MNLKKAKALRKAAGVRGAEVGYVVTNPARGIRVTLEYPEKRLCKAVKGNLIDSIKGERFYFKTVAVNTIFTPEGTRHCTGPRAIYHALRAQ